MSTGTSDSTKRFERLSSKSGAFPGLSARRVLEKLTKELLDFLLGRQHCPSSGGCGLIEFAVAATGELLF